MTETPEGGARPADTALSVTRALLNDFSALLNDQVRAARAGQAELSEKELGDRLSLLTRLALRLADEDSRLETERQRAKGAARGYALDLDAARSEIGVRLACLRERAGSGNIPE